MTALEEYVKRSREVINKEDPRGVYIDDHCDIEDLLLELQGYRKAYNQLLEEKRKLSEKIKEDSLKLEIISNLIEVIEVNIELSKVVE